MISRPYTVYTACMKPSIACRIANNIGIALLMFFNVIAILVAVAVLCIVWFEIASFLWDVLSRLPSFI